MKRTRFDKPIGSCYGSYAKLEEDSGPPPPKGRARKSIAEEYDIHPFSIGLFRRRHPEVANWSDEQVAAQIAANKDQSSVARRLGQKKRASGNNSFGKMPPYGDPP